MANRRRTDTEGKYKKRVEEAETYKDIAGVLPGIGTAITVSDIEDELSKEDPSYLKVGILGASEAAGLIPGVGGVAKTLIRKGAQRLDDAADIVNAEKLVDDADAMKQWQEANKLPETKRQANPTAAQQAADDLFEGKITSKEARERIGGAIPKAREFSAEEVMGMMPSVTQLTGSLGKKAGKYGILGVKGFDLEAGQKVSSRLDIPAYNNYDTWVVSIHDGTKDAGSVVGFGQAIRLKNIRFGSKSKEALDIARGKRRTPSGEDKPMGKSTIARVFGEYVPENPYDLQEKAADIIASGSDEWTQVGMNPYRGSGFYIKETGQPVFEADEVIQVGALVLAKNVKKPTITQMKELGVKTADGKTRLFNEGGMALEEQMDMNFGTGEVDPISGNEVPTGSLPEEVRDDIPAQLSEGEYVVPADVVRYWGVKVFEDMRREAKMGFEEMDEDGRIGGEPMTMELGDGMGLELSDLEVMEMPDDTPEVEEAFLGKFFAGIRESNRRQQEKNRQSVRDRFKAAEERKSVNKIKAGTNKKPKFKNKAEELIYNFNNRNKSTNDDRRVTLTQKPPTSDDDRSSGTIAEQINFGGDYDKTEKKKATPKTVKPGGRATPFVDDAPEKEGVNLRSTESFGTKFMRGLGIEGYSEGGDVFKQKGGFDMSEATPVEGVAAGEVTEGMTMEAVIYVNDAGHEITIMFANGVPITPIPAGYYPKSETVAPETGTQGGGGNDDPPETPQPQSINYKELSITELTEMVKEQGDLKGSVMAGLVGALNPFLGIAAKAAMVLHQKNIEKELKRRRADPTTSNVDQMRLDNLIEYTEREKPNFLDKITGKAFEKTVSQIPKPVTPDEDYSDPTMAPSVATPYTPEATTPEVTESGTLTDEQMSQIEQASKEAAEIAFGQPNPFEGSTYDEVAAPVVDPDPEDTASSNVTTPTVRGDSRQERDAQRRRDRQEANRNMAGQSTSRKTRATKSATRGLSSKQKQGGAGLDSRFGVTGLKDGGLVDKPTVEKVVKGLKKASKSHAKQADQLEKALKKKSK